LYAWGFNGAGQLATGDEIQQDSPVQIGSDSNWKMVSPADGVFINNAVIGMHTAGLREGMDGICVSGANYTGQLGTGTTNDLNSFDCAIGEDLLTIEEVEVGQLFELFSEQEQCFRLSIDPALAQKNMSLYLLTINGQLVYTEKVQNGTVLDFGAFAKGVYLVELNSEDKGYRTKIVLR
jgi:alpha-tubulin suppressor-like RCC1 family protein